MKPPDSFLRGAGMYRLRFPITLDSRTTLPDGMPLQLTGQISLSPSNDWIGFAQTDRPVVTNAELPFDAHLILVVDDNQLAVIEDRRAGSDLRLQVLVDVTLGYDPGPNPASQGPEGADGEAWPTVRAEQEVEVQSGSWQRLLQQTAAGTSLAVVMPVPIGTDRPAARAGELLRDALRKVNNGEFSDAVVSARKALDAFGGAWQAEKAIISTTAPPSRTFDQRRAMLRHATWSLASSAAHGDNVADQFEWDRAGSLAVIAAVAALLATA